MLTRRRFSREYKLEAVRLVTQRGGVSMAQAARVHGPSTRSIAPGLQPRLRGHLGAADPEVGDSGLILLVSFRQLDGILIPRETDAVVLARDVDP